MEKILIFGAGGHAKVIFDIIQRQAKYSVQAFVSSNADQTSYLGLPVVQQSRFTESNIPKGIIAIGDNFTRDQISKFILDQNKHFEFVSAVHPSAQIAAEVEIGIGTVVMANVAVNSGSHIGSHVILNTGCNVDHDCRIENYASIAPGCTLGGKVKLGSHSSVSLGANVIHGIEIGQHTVIGAGSTVLANVGNFEVAFGSPCRHVRKRVAGEKYL